VAFIFSNSNFYVQNCRFRALFCRLTAYQAKIQKSTSHVSGISTKKALCQNVEKHPFSAHSTRLVTPEAKFEKTAPIHQNSDSFPDSHQMSKLSDISSRILISLKKAGGLVFNRG
jgi:hypothetical protein